MFATTFPARSFTNDGPPDPDRVGELVSQAPAWVLAYGSEDLPCEGVAEHLARHLPDVPVFGATSFRGVFTPTGFTRDVALLAGNRSDVQAFPCLQHATATTAEERAFAACQQIEQQAGGRPSTLLLHATPGFEERILDGVRRAWGKEVPVYGGSAADDELQGKWRVFSGSEVSSEGFLMVGFHGARKPLGGFLGGYLPTGCSGRVTAAAGRVIEEIDGRPAAEVYDEWTEGAIAEELAAGGNVLLKTNLLPLARVVDQAHGMPRRVLSHPQEVLPDTRALKLFTDFREGDDVTLMTSTKEPLVGRVRRVVQRARGPAKGSPSGGLLIYCGGCLGLLLDQADRIGEEFGSEIGGAPFIGIATFGEQGAFFSRSDSWHGNLMCSAVLF